MKYTLFFLNFIFLLLFVSCEDKPSVPNSIMIFSGNNQTSEEKTLLEEPVKFIIYDQYGKQYNNDKLKITFSINEGFLSKKETYTENGVAEVEWVLGSSLGKQVLTVSADNLNGKPLNESPLIVTAIATEVQKIQPIQDIDGNNYNVKAYGSQLWMTENLITTKLNDNVEISMKTNPTAWSYDGDGTEMPAYCIYNNDNSKGLYYNWYAVNTNKLCPSGWRVPSRNDWKLLEEYLSKSGGNSDSTLIIYRPSKIAKALADISNWNESDNYTFPGNNQYLNNSSGFLAKPNGKRSAWDSEFQDIGGYAYFWTTSLDNSYTPARPSYIYISYKKEYVDYNSYLKTCGINVRCVKDK